MSFGKGVFADVMKLRILRGDDRALFGWALNPMAGSLLEIELEEMQASGEGHVKVEAETGVCSHKPRKGWSHGSGEREEGLVSGACRRSTALVTPQVQTSEPQNYERINVYFKKRFLNWFLEKEGRGGER